jgi:hypothetical protein
MHPLCQMRALPGVLLDMEDSKQDSGDSLRFSERFEGPAGHGSMKTFPIETPAHHVYDNIAMDQSRWDGDLDGKAGRYVVIAEHGEEYLLAPMVPVVRRFLSMEDARNVVAGLINDHRRKGESVSMIADSKWEGCYMLHSRERTITIQLDPRLEEVAYHCHRQTEIRREQAENEAN